MIRNTNEPRRAERTARGGASSSVRDYVIRRGGERSDTVLDLMHVNSDSFRTVSGLQLFSLLARVPNI